MRGVDDGEDGLNDRAFESALGGGRKRRGGRRSAQARQGLTKPAAARPPVHEVPQLKLPALKPTDDHAAAKRDLEARIIECARNWYRYDNEADLAAAVQLYEQLLKAAQAGAEP